jgi:hypothetical protein
MEGSVLREVFCVAYETPKQELRQAHHVALAATQSGYTHQTMPDRHCELL